ncbi:MAG: SDR family oxidoreductase [Candidatus Theseobacter exili]|nr:SDR family oxidoreductase [Candidatus Theseobacter exili]
MKQKDFSLKGKTALVTGAARRLGRAICIALAKKGVNILVHYNESETEANILKDEIRALGVNVWTIKADLESRDQCDDLISRCLQIAGDIHILINNASIFPSDRLLEFSIEDLLKNLQINAVAPFILSRKFVKTGSTGRIINLLDSRITGYDRDHAAYDLSKKLLLEMTKMLALELAPDITVNAVAPGLVLPPEGTDMSYVEERAKMIPLEQHGCEKDVSDAVLFLLQSSFTTGQVLFVDGGRHLKGTSFTK